MRAKDIINFFGSQSALAAALGKSQSTISYWAKTGLIPVKSQTALLALAAERGIELSASDFIAPNEKSLVTLKSNKNNELNQKSSNVGRVPIVSNELEYQIQN